MIKRIYQLHSLKELALFTKNTLKYLSDYHVITLKGDLGSGKTAFTKKLGAALGYKKRIVSPSFVLMKLYKLPKNKFSYKYLCHADFYRFAPSSFSGLTEYINNKKVLTVIEWPEKIKKLPPKRLELTFTLMKNDARKITLLPKSGKKKRA
ncbi:MAG: tRNA (adenosine(37)-N6)-threonylcarbamoyltransferase complex ATPase subunit type 1 TsaE [Patescibacteria group bacterium]|jgi:tRNA threonylcarbamoyladenosine biosynthesis protein TsaE